MEGGKDKQLPASRRQTVVAGLAAVIVTEPLAVGGAAEAAADAYEIPVDQQCIECAGGGVNSCTRLSTSQCAADVYYDASTVLGKRLNVVQVTCVAVQASGVHSVGSAQRTPTSL